MLCMPTHSAPVVGLLHLCSVFGDGAGRKALPPLRSLQRDAEGRHAVHQVQHVTSRLNLVQVGVLLAEEAHQDAKGRQVDDADCQDQQDDLEAEGDDHLQRSLAAEQAHQLAQALAAAVVADRGVGDAGGRLTAARHGALLARLSRTLVCIAAVAVRAGSLEQCGSVQVLYSTRQRGGLLHTDSRWGPVSRAVPRTKLCSTALFLMHIPCCTHWASTSSHTFL